MDWTPSKVWLRASQCELCELEGQTVTLAILDLQDLYRIPWLLSEGEAAPAFRLDPQPTIDFSAVEATQKVVNGAAIVGHPQSCGGFQSLDDVEDLSTLLEDLPEGTEMELCTASDAQESTHRYVGRVKAGKWQLTHTYPQLTSKALREALELTGGQDRTEVELEAQLSEMNAFRSTFEDGPWPIAPSQMEDPEAGLLIAQLMAHFTPADPSGESLLLAGEFGRYFSADIVSCEHLVEEDVTLLDQEMEGLGFQVLGDLSCNQVELTVMRGFSGPPGVFFVATAMHGTYFTTEFYTSFEDGSSLTTSTNPDAFSLPSKKIVRQNFPALEPKALWARHQSSLKKTKSPPRQWEESLKGLAMSIDEYLQRQGHGF